jgi:hypothetical protein
MSNDSDPVTARRSTTVSAIAFAAAFSLHGIDHLRRGMAASPMSIMIGGMIQGFFVVVAVALILRQHRWASEAAIVVGSAARCFLHMRICCPLFCRAIKTASRLYLGSTSHGSRGSRPSPRLGPDWCSATSVCARGAVGWLSICRPLGNAADTTQSWAVFASRERPPGADLPIICWPHASLSHVTCA